MTISPLSDMAYRQILDFIQHEGLQPDDRLPAENRMAETLGISRPVVRQALARLRSEGWVHARRGSGNFVGKPPVLQHTSFDPLQSIPDVRNFLEFRRLIEGESAACAARHGTPEMIENITAKRRQLDAAMSRGEPGIEEDIAFHGAIAVASGNRFFSMTMAALAEQTRIAIRLIRDLSPQPGIKRAADTRREHHAIDDAIRSRDPQAAHDAMMAHLRGGLERLFGISETRPRD
ncbi:FadR/GntR family transcriptional regulator [Paracandidimonas soli]|uniref:FadR/GntR family transcriptional regulator n=1 Tax=Paracandidimonas soli TaxID=1917182 RepID=UPI0033419EE6